MYSLRSVVLSLSLGLFTSMFSALLSIACELGKRLICWNDNIFNLNCRYMHSSAPVHSMHINWEYHWVKSYIWTLQRTDKCQNYHGSEYKHTYTHTHVNPNTCLMKQHDCHCKSCHFFSDFSSSLYSSPILLSLKTV